LFKCITGKWSLSIPAEKRGEQAKAADLREISPVATGFANVYDE
jgi:hypothetical protein